MNNLEKTLGYPFRKVTPRGLKVYKKYGLLDPVPSDPDALSRKMAEQSILFADTEAVAEIAKVTFQIEKQPDWEEFDIGILKAGIRLFLWQQPGPSMELEVSKDSSGETQTEPR
jgi:hypothetical protein